MIEDDSTEEELESVDMKMVHEYQCLDEENVDMMIKNLPELKWN